VNYPEENIQHTEHGESLKSRILCISLRRWWAHIRATLCSYHEVPYHIKCICKKGNLKVQQRRILINFEHWLFGYFSNYFSHFGPHVCKTFITNK